MGKKIRHVTIIWDTAFGVMIKKFYQSDKIFSKVKVLQTTYKNVWLMLSKAFSKSEKKITPGLFSSSALSIISKSKRMFSYVYVL